VFWLQKTRVPALSYGVVCVILRLAVLVPCRLCDRQTDEQTDRRTHDDSIYRASVAWRSKNFINNINPSDIEMAFAN